MPARDLYSSDWFLKARDYVEAQKAKWFILSAKHGLVPPHQVIQPYNVTLNDMNSGQRCAWASGVANQLRPKCRAGDLVMILAGHSYREYLIPSLKSWGCDVKVPMEGMGIGQQKAWLKRQLRLLGFHSHFDIGRFS